MPADPAPTLTPPPPPPSARQRPAWPLLVLLALVGLMALVVGLAVPHWLDRARVARDLEAGIAAATGLAVRIEGAPRLRLWPRPALEIGPIHLTGPVPAVDPAADAAAATGASPLADADGSTAVRTSITAARVRLDLATLPLLARRVEVRGAHVEGLRIDWDDPAGDFALGLATPRLDLGPFARGPDGLTGPIAAAVRVTGRAPDLAGDLVLAGALRLAPATGALMLAPLHLTGRDLAIGARRGLPLELRAAVAFDPARRAVALDDVLLTADTLRVGGTAHVSRAVNGLRVQGDAQVAPFDLRDWLGRYGYGPGRGAADRLRRVAAELRFDARLGGADGPRLDLQDGRLRCDATSAGFAARLAWPARVGGAGIGVRVGLPGRWPVGEIAVGLDRLDLDPYLLVHGVAPVPPSSPPGSPTGSPPTSASALPPATPPAPPDLDSTPPPLPEPAADGAALTLVAAATELRVGGLRLGAVDARAVAAGPALRLRLRAQDLYTGRLDLDLTARVAPSAAAPDADLAPAAAPVPAAAATGTLWALEATAVGAAIGPLLADLTGTAPPLTGSADLRAELGGRGDDPDAVARHLGGRVDLAVRDGVLTGIDLDRLIGAAAGLTTGPPSASAPAPPTAPGGTRFDLLSASAIGADGRFRSDDIAGRSARLAMTGVGDVEVPTQSLALALNVTLTRPPDGSGIRELEGVAIPVQVTGSWSDPRWQVDSRAALDAAARRLLDGRAGDRLDALEQQLGIPGLRQGVEQGLQRGLRSLFGR